MKHFTKGFYVVILCISISILFFGSIKYFYSDKYISKRTLNSIFKGINSINKNLSFSMDDKETDIEKASSLIKESLPELKVLKDKLENLDDTLLKNPNIKKDLNNCINDTISLYNYLFNSLYSPRDVINNDSIDDLTNIIENCKLSYDKASSYSSKKIKFSKENIDFFNSYYYYLNTLIKANRDIEFLSKQNREFIIKLESFQNSMDTLNKDFSLAIDKVREDKRDLTVIIDDIYTKEELFQDLKEKAFSLSIPDGYLNAYNSLFDYINYYEIYITTLKNAVIYEKTCSDIKKYSAEISKNYKNAYSKREDVLTSYEDFILIIKNN